MADPGSSENDELDGNQSPSPDNGVAPNSTDYEWQLPCGGREVMVTSTGNETFTVKDDPNGKEPTLKDIYICTYMNAWRLEDGEWKMIGAPTGDRFSLLLSSEPLTRDTSTWLEVPEYSALASGRVGGVERVQITYFDV